LTGLGEFLILEQKGNIDGMAEKTSNGTEKIYVPTIGLEIHAELRTATKMFCNSKNDTDETRPNVNICPVCMGYPGTLPTINKEAVRHVLRLGTAVGGKLADYTEFDRKNYFYPDIPKGYQISQYKYPLVSGGNLAGVEITRVHLEEDTSKSSHEGTDGSLVDFNRAGVPLMELVTEPVIHSAEDAGKFAREFKLLLQYLGASEANMEKGEMRVEANISVGTDGKLGTKVEVKNLNSFRAMEKAIKYEIERHKLMLEKGEKIAQETRGWDENKEETFSQRAKEDSHDYRYFPEPDLPKLFINEIPEFSTDSLKDTLTELPSDKRNRFKTEFGIKDEDVEIYVQDLEKGSFFENVINTLGDNKLAVLASNYIISDLTNLNVEAGSFAKLIQMVNSGELSSRGAKDTLKIICEKGGDPKTIATENNFIQSSDMGAIEEIAKKIIFENATAVEEYKNGKEASLMFLIGQGMKVSKGSANPTVLKESFLKLLK
jgi:aspartyl-tRNA(Asn)/glutamyl-tRNA(Gln) amidotransferase subunit B